jgi:hypothetical protein
MNKEITDILNLNLNVSRETFEVMIEALSLYDDLMSGRVLSIPKLLYDNVMLTTDEYNNFTFHTNYLVEFSIIENATSKDYGIRNLIDKITTKSNSVYDNDTEMVETNIALRIEEYNLLIRGLDLYNRMLSGQYNIIDETLNYHGLYNNENHELGYVMKRVYRRDANGAINAAPLKAQIGYDLYKQLRYESALEERHSVWSHEPTFKYSNEKMDVKFR